MDVSLRATGGVYDVRGESGATYRVDIGDGTCSCPDWQIDRHAGDCKHLHRVRLELDRGSVPSPDGRIPGRSRTRETLVSDAQSNHSASTGPHQETGITGPHYEYDRYGDPTGTTYYRCTSCGCEAVRRSDLEGHECDGGRESTRGEDAPRGRDGDAGVRP